MGNNTTTSRSSPISVFGDRSYSQISVANAHMLAIEGSTGNAYSWGFGNSGRLGDNTTTDRSSPVSVVGGRSYSQIATGQANNAAIEGSTGNMYTWGINSTGQLGNNTITSSSSPVSVVGGRSYNQVSGGIDHMLAIEASTGNAYSFGSNSSGQLGDNTSTNRSSPTSVVGGRSFNQIAGGNIYSLAYEMSTGAIWAWGSNFYGQCGVPYLSIPRSNTTLVISDMAQGIRVIESSTGRAYAWGTNASGQLGDNTTTSKSSPISVAGGRSFRRITAATSATAAIEGSTGRAYAWGFNSSTSSGILGDNTTTNRSSPTSVAGGRSYSRIAGGHLSLHFVAIEGSTGRAYAWGSGQSGKLGDNTTTARSSPISVAGGRSYSRVSVNSDNSLAIEGSTGRAYAWGSGSGGFLGDNTTTSKSSPNSVAGGRSFREIAVGSSHMLAIEGSTGNVYAWGTGIYGQLGDNTVASKSSPVSVVGGRSFSAIAAGSNYSLAIEGSTGNAYAWGANNLGGISSGMLGNYSLSGFSSPISVVGGRSYNLIAAGSATSTAYEESTGIIYLWGRESALFNYTINNNYSSPVSVGRLFPID